MKAGVYTVDEAARLIEKAMDDDVRTLVPAKSPSHTSVC